MTALPSRTLPVTMLLAAAVSCGSACAQTATEAELARRLDQLAAELAAVKAQLAQLEQRPSTAAPTTAAGAPASAPAASATTTVSAAVSPPAPPAPSGEPATVLSGYAELNYNRPIHASQNAQAAMRPFVLGYQNR